MERLMWKLYIDQCSIVQVPFLHAKNPFKTTLNSSHLSYQLLPKETSQEANCAMVDSFTLLLSKILNPFMSKSHFSTAYVVKLNLFICYQYYITTSHILSTSEFHVGSIFSLWFFTIIYFVLVLDNVEFIKVHLQIVLSHRPQHTIWETRLELCIVPWNFTCINGKFPHWWSREYINVSCFSYPVGDSNLTHTFVPDMLYYCTMIAHCHHLWFVSCLLTIFIINW